MKGDHLPPHKAPANTGALARLQHDSGLPLPPDYLAFLSFSNGWDSVLGVEPGWYVIWPAEDVLEHQQALETSTNIPGFWAFGSNGAGEMLAFDTRAEQPWPIVMIPYIPLDSAEALPVTDTFAALVALLEVDTDDPCNQPPNSPAQ